jgi:hypothetical protein
MSGASALYVPPDPNTAPGCAELGSKLQGLKFASRFFCKTLVFPAFVSVHAFRSVRFLGSGRKDRP